MPEDREERLEAMHPRMIASFDASIGGLTLFRPGWTKVNDYQYYHESIIDLSGYALQNLSFFPTSVGVQDPGNYLFTATDPAVTATSLQVIDMITSTPMNPAQVGDLALAAIAPGMLGSPHEFETILMGQWRYLTPSPMWASPGATLQGITGLQRLERAQRFDSGDATAADKLYCYRIVNAFAQGSITPPTDGTQIRIPAARQLIAGMMVEEDFLPHMMRLKRSYELANQV